MKNYRYLIGVVIGVVLIGGGIVIMNRPSELQESELKMVTENISDPTSELVLPTDTIVIVEEPKEEVQAENTPTVAAPPTPRTELVSTDPSTVNLAYGDIQLVELFAFW